MHVSGAVILVTYIAMMIVCSGRGGHLLPVPSWSQDRRNRCRVPAVRGGDGEYGGRGGSGVWLAFQGVERSTSCMDVCMWDLWVKVDG